MPEKTIRIRAKNVDLVAKNGFFIAVGTEAFIWTAKVSIKQSEKNVLPEFWEHL
ncbi:MAG: hypothetical protein J0L67_13055 [Cytophagales bacterium]|nr:hypothetical protein [Cytophagales bacterium]